MNNIHFSPVSHSFNEGIAIVTKSIAAATIFNHIFFWLRINKGKGSNQHEGRTWMYQSISEISLHFPYLSEQQVKDSIFLLVKHGYLLKGNFSQNKFDRTNWYSCANEDWIAFQKSFAIGSPDPISTVHGTDLRVLPTQSSLYTYNNTDNKEIRNEAAPLSQFFYEKLKVINPKIKKPNFDSWEKEIDKIRKDGEGNTDEEIKQVIEYLISTHGSPSANGFCWANVTLSTASLRKNYAKIWTEMKNANSPKQGPETPYDKVSKLFKNGERYNKAECYLNPESIAFERGLKNESVKLDKYFTWSNLEKLCDSFQINIQKKINKVN